MSGFRVEINQPSDLLKDMAQWLTQESARTMTYQVLSFLMRSATCEDLLKSLREIISQAWHYGEYVDHDDLALVILRLAKEIHTRRRIDVERAEREIRDQFEALFRQFAGRLRFKSKSLDCPILPNTKNYIFRELIPEWELTPEEPSKESKYAFRRMIAMGWPQREEVAPNPSEFEVELNARGRFVHEKERELYIASIREHLQRCCGRLQAEDADAIFAPWLTQESVPDEILKLLVMARAKLGGPALALRDIENAKRLTV